jgi:hypothetical protein
MKTITAVNIDKKEVCRYLGYNGRSPPASISLIDSQIARAYKLIKPAYTYELKAIDSIQGDEVFVKGSLVFTSKTISYVLSNCEWVVVFLVTIGNDLEEESSKLIEKGEMLKATILDAIGTEAVEKTACNLQDAIEGIAKTMACQATLRYSPGYCDWDVNQQKVIFQAIDSTSLGVRLTKGCMMVPLKSISGIIGIGKLDKTKHPPCLTCSRKGSCPYKRTRL